MKTNFLNPELIIEDLKKNVGLQIMLKLIIFLDNLFNFFVEKGHWMLIW